jgi:hypothetical protein
VTTAVTESHISADAAPRTRRQIAESALNWVSAGGRSQPHRNADSVRVAVNGLAAITLVVRGIIRKLPHDLAVRSGGVCG